MSNTLYTKAVTKVSDIKLVGITATIEKNEHGTLSGLTLQDKEGNFLVVKGDRYNTPVIVVNGDAPKVKKYAVVGSLADGFPYSGGIHDTLDAAEATIDKLRDNFPQARFEIQTLEVDAE